MPDAVSLDLDAALGAMKVSPAAEKGPLKAALGCFFDPATRGRGRGVRGRGVRGTGVSGAGRPYELLEGSLAVLGGSVQGGSSSGSLKMPR